MPFPQGAQSKGGKAPASDLQKQVAAACIKLNKPWLKSTGPKTARGKAIASQNRNRATLELRSWEFPTVEQFDQATALAEDLIKAEFAKLTGYRATYRKYRRVDKDGTYIRFSLSAVQEQQTAQNHPAIERLKQLMGDRPGGHQDL